MSIGYVWLATLAPTCILGQWTWTLLRPSCLDARGHVVARAFSDASSTRHGNIVVSLQSAD